MSIRLNRKKLLCISFFLCCVLPACFSWFEYVSETWRGLSLLELPLLVSTTLFGFALMFERPHYMLPLGIFSHILLLVFIIRTFVNFPVISGIAAARDLALSLELVRPSYWVGIALPVVHLALFTTTEIAVQNLAKQSAAQSKKEDY